MNKNKFFLGIVPARGGSKRLPRKNIIELGGKPLIYYSIKAAQESDYLNDFIFSTEDNEIKEIAEGLIGNKISYKRPLNLSGDDVRNTETMIHALKWYEKEYRQLVDAIVLLQPTSTFRQSYHIDQAIKKFCSKNNPVLASVSGPYKKRDVRIKKIDSNGDLINYTNNDKNEGYFTLNASIYIIEKQYLLKNNRFVDEKMTPYIMDEFSSLDIDNKNDYELSKIQMREYRKT